MFLMNRFIKILFLGHATLYDTANGEIFYTAHEFKTLLKLQICLGIICLQCVVKITTLCRKMA